MLLTPEQLHILDSNANLVINAVAGSGKTTTLIEYARTRSISSRILYLAFNKSVKTEAEQKFAAAGVKNVKVDTAHSLAYHYIVSCSKYRVNGSGFKSYEWTDILRIATGDRHTDYILGGHVNKFISYFCNSTAQKITELNYADVVIDPSANQFVNNFYSLIEKLTRIALKKMDDGDINITHDFYLKKFQLQSPQLPYDYILFDEGQDASAAMLDVFLHQPCTKIIVGDIHQQIYGWRYAINSLHQVDFPVLPLSHSFRFDEEIALVANKILQWKERNLQFPKPVKVIGCGFRCPISATKATLARTNLSLLVRAVDDWQGRSVAKVFFEGNINSYTFADEGASLYDVLNLQNGRYHKIRDKLIAGMKSIEELQDYINKTEDNSLGMIVEVVKKYGDRLPSLINGLKLQHTETRQQADMIYSTVHKCKGMEYDEVRLLDDFITEEKLKHFINEMGGEKITPGNLNRLSEELNILYVAATRAKNKLYLPVGLNPFETVHLVHMTEHQTYRNSYHSKYDFWLDTEREPDFARWKSKERKTRRKR